MVSGSMKQPLGIRGRTALREVTQTLRSLHRWENGDMSKERDSYRLFFQNKKSENEGRTFSWVIIFSADGNLLCGSPGSPGEMKAPKTEVMQPAGDLVGFCLGVLWLPGPGRLC